MATADQIEKIIIEMEERGVAGVAFGVKRIDDVIGDLEKRQGPAGVLEGFNALQAALSKSLVDLPNMAQLTDQATAAWVKLVAQVKRYDQAQSKKRERNAVIEGARKDAQGLAAAMQAANRIPTELQQAPKALTAGQRAFQAFARVAGPRATQGLVSTVGVLEKVGPIASKIGPPVANAAMAVGAVSVAAAGVGIYAAKEFGGAVIQAQAFREDMQSALEIITHSQKEADAVMKRALETADFIGADRASTVGQFTDLMGKGFDKTTADNIVRSMADLKAKAPNAQIDRLVFAFGQINTKGKLATEELNQLKEAGFNTGTGLQILAKKAGKSVEDIKKDVEAGTINSIDAVQALLEGSNKDIGKGAMGQAAHDKSMSSTSGLLRMLGDIPSNILFDVKVGPGMGALKDQLGSIVEYFRAGTDSGERVRKVAGDLFNALVTGLTGKSVDTKKGIAGTLDAIVAGAEKAVPTVQSLAAGISWLAGVGADLIGTAAWFAKMSESVGGLGRALQIASFPARLLLGTFTLGAPLWPEVATGIGAVVDKAKSLRGMSLGQAVASFAPDASAMFFGLDVKLGDALSGMWSTVQQAGAQMYSSAMTIGTNLWQGLVNGITGGVGAVLGAAKGLANSALSAVGVTWRVGSPAKAFEDLSLWAGAGAERGFYKSESTVAGAAASMANAGLGAAWAAGQANVNGGAMITPMAGAGSAPVAVNTTFNIIVSGASTPEQAQAIGDAAVRGSRAAFEAQLGETMRRLRYG